MQTDRSSLTHKAGSLGSPPEVHGPRIKLLSDLHRPLEEHWAGNSKKKGKGLDAIGSDYTYKHHITRLEEIYMTPAYHPSLGFGEDKLADKNIISPQAQLYGVQGLLAPHLQHGYEEWKEKRETGWNPYVKVADRPQFLDKVSAISEKRVPPPPKQPQPSPKQRKEQQRSISPTSRQTASSSPDAATLLQQRNFSPVNSAHPRQRPSSAAATAPRQQFPPVNFQQQQHYQQHQQQYQQPQQHNQQRQRPARWRCSDPSAPLEALLINGQYRLNAQQDSVYKAFVELLLQFDDFDQRHILEDAIRDARDAALLDSFGARH